MGRNSARSPVALLVIGWEEVAIRAGPGWCSSCSSVLVWVRCRCCSRCLGLFRGTLVPRLSPGLRAQTPWWVLSGRSAGTSHLGWVNLNSLESGLRGAAGASRGAQSGRLQETTPSVGGGDTWSAGALWVFGSRVGPHRATPAFDFGWFSFPLAGSGGRLRAQIPLLSLLYRGDRWAGVRRWGRGAVEPRIRWFSGISPF